MTTKMQELAQTAKKFIHDGNYEEYFKTLDLIKKELERVVKEIKSKVAPLEPLTIDDFRASKPFTSPFLTNTFMQYDDKMNEVLQIFKKEDMEFYIDIYIDFCDQYTNLFVGSKNEEFYINVSDFDDIDFDKIIYEIYDYLNIYPALVLLGAYEINNQESRNLKVYGFNWG